MPKASEHFTTAQQEIWRSRIKAEMASIRDWKANWGFLVPSACSENLSTPNRPVDLPEPNPQIIRDQVKVGYLERMYKIV
jgi:hypothetical protein